ncbi:MAG: transcription-repair coupling factor [Muribaculaceae bacterium]|nr:transcription-repair coupling factor [Muribaculaceae bacterium]
MTLHDILPLFLTPSRRKAVEALVAARDKEQIGLYGLAGSSPAALFAGLDGLQNGPMLIICSDIDDAGYLYNDIAKFVGENRTLIFPSGYRRAIKYGQPDPPSEILRTEVLRQWHTNPDLLCVVTFPEALAEKVATAEMVNEKTLSLNIDEPVDLTVTLKWLLDNGFNRVDYVYEPGQFAVRGSILDVFGYSNEKPYRLDFFGDDIESIRTFNIETQLSESKLTAITVTPRIDSEADCSLLDFVGEPTLTFVRDNADVVARVEEIAAADFSTLAQISAEDDTDTNAMNHVVSPSRLAEAYAKLHPITFSAAPLKTETQASMDFNCSPQVIYHKNFQLISDDFHRLLSQNHSIHILSDSAKQIERLKIIFADRGDNIDFTPVDATLHEGFIDHSAHTGFLTDHQIFDRFHKYNLRSDRVRSGKVALSLKELNEITPGDFIVHSDHGIGRFAGLIRQNVNGNVQEMIKLVYQNDDIILVSIHSLHKLSKYRGKEGVPPTISRLGTGAWNRIKERAKSKLKDIARDLIRLYAARLEEKGFAFSPDTYLQHELEASFIYEDTPDQITTTAAVKTDMESAKPMDRLICGDVGFGKTEIAIRAAFKAAADNKQTAVLVPTTVLAYQHFNTFSDRLRDFPVKVEYLSRARSAKETKQILAELAEGKIDVIIGTHKLIGKNVRFHDLGLLVVDEEQKFGVAVKDKLKQIKTNVDTLTMTATPIPRTLQFSLMGARDLSVISTPPPNRYPIVTTIDTLSDDIVAEAINFELSRNGQVFVVNPRIEGLFTLENMVRRLVPDARTVVAHGQMPPDRLEEIIMGFTNHDYDVMLATTIIESGLDMPNVNTMIINNAQHFGLSELHQLRGRVGRSSRKAFCYLMVPPGAPLTAIARRRLQAIESFSDLGSGIHIAMQDLDIRGAGNLLGAEQSGFIADLGYETYQRILREAVVELRTEEFPDIPADTTAPQEQEFVADCTIESDMPILIPADYVEQESERMSLYRRLDTVENESQLVEFENQLIDRFGPIPEPTRQLLNIPRIRDIARRLGVEKVILKQQKMFAYLVGTENVAYYQNSQMLNRIIAYYVKHPLRCQTREYGGRKSFVVKGVYSADSALKILREIIGDTPSTGE